MFSRIRLILFPLVVAGAIIVIEVNKPISDQATEQQASTESEKVATEHYEEPAPAIRQTSQVIGATSSNEATRKIKLQFLPCVGGSSDNRLVVMPENVEQLLSLGYSKVCVVAFGTFRHSHYKPSKDDTSPRLVALLQDASRLGIESVDVYELERSDGTIRLAVQGQLSLSELEKLTQSDSNALVVNYLDLSTKDHATRKIRVYALPCVGGAMDGKRYPLLEEPSGLFDAGLDVVFVPDMTTVYPEPLIGKSADKYHPKSNCVGNLSMYALEKSGSTFRLAYVATLNAIEYLRIHNPKSIEDIKHVD